MPVSFGSLCFFYPPCLKGLDLSRLLGVKIILIFLSLFLTKTHAQVNLEKHDFSFEYGLMFHTLEAREKNRNSSGKLTTNQMPYYNLSYSLRLPRDFGLKIFGGLQVLRYEEPAGVVVKKEDQVLNEFGLELMKRMNTYSRLGIFFRHQDQNVYYAKDVAEFEVEKIPFIHSGLGLSLGQRRRVGLLWGVGGEGYLIFPSRGGEVATELGHGGKVFARLGFATSLGTLYQFKASQMVTSAPNARVSFTHSIAALSLMVSHQF